MTGNHSSTSGGHRAYRNGPQSPQPNEPRNLGYTRSTRCVRVGEYSTDLLPPLHCALQDPPSDIAVAVCVRVFVLAARRSILDDLEQGIDNTSSKLKKTMNRLNELWEQADSTWCPSSRARHPGKNANIHACMNGSTRQMCLLDHWYSDGGVDSSDCARDLRVTAYSRQCFAFDGGILHTL